MPNFEALSSNSAATFSISGTAEQGQTLIITQDSDDPEGQGQYPLTYSWQTTSEEDITQWTEVGTSQRTLSLLLIKVKRSKQ